MADASATSSVDASAVALTTVFTPAMTCTGLTFSSPSYSVWYNEPVVAASTTMVGCYPSQWLSGYTSLSTSSIAVALNPLVCPSGWTTALNTTSSYIACCPTGYAVHFPDTTVDSQRPAYGGLCFSAFGAPTSLTVAEYNATAFVQTQTVPFATPGQIFAHVIDGYASKRGVVAAPTSQTSSSVSASPTSVSHHKHLSGGAIAGIVIGCIAALTALLVFGFFILRHHKRKQSDKTNESGAAALYESDPSALVSEKDGQVAKDAKKAAELSSGKDAAFEMESPPVLPEPVELESHSDPYWDTQR